MKMIEAVFRAEKLDAVKNALRTLGVSGATAVEVSGFGRQLGQTETYRGAEVEISFRPKMMLKVVVDEAAAAAAVNAIADAARTGEVGDGKIFVYPVSEIIRIRTGERDRDAL